MAGYTIVNLREIEDVAPKGGLSPGMQSRFAHVPLELQQLGLSLFRVAPGFRVPFGHHHTDQEEIYVVLSGGLRLKLDDEIVELGAWDAVRIAPETVRGMEGGPDGAEILAVGAPSNQNADAQMVKDFWD